MSKVTKIFLKAFVFPEDEISTALSTQRQRQAESWKLQAGQGYRVRRNFKKRNTSVRYSPAPCASEAGLLGFPCTTCNDHRSTNFFKMESSYSSKSILLF